MDRQSVVLLSLLTTALLLQLPLCLLVRAEESLCGADNYCISGSCTNDTCTCSESYPVCNLPNNATCADIADFCLNGGTCQKENRTLSCACDTGFSGSRCQISECADPDSQCRRGDGVACLNDTLTGNVTCDCGHCYTGDDCSTEVELCTEENNFGDCVHGECVTKCDALSPPVLFCKCGDLGWEGPRCQFDIKECSADPHPCLNNGTCTELRGSYSCDCTPGWTAINCEQDIDECFEPGYCHQTNRKSCDNSAGSYTCVCNDGYDGINCDMPSCDATPYLCLNHGNCSTNDTHWACDCAEFFSGDRCDIRGPCLDKPCVNGVCTQSPDAEGNLMYTCACDQGFKNASNCAEDVAECLTSPCENNGTCTNTDGSFYCTCSPYWESDDCSQDVKECLLEGICGTGECIEMVGGFECNCTDPEWIGDRCEIRNYCHNGCKIENTVNGDSCTNTADGFVCRCTEEWLPPNCSVMDLCRNMVCANNGTCISPAEGNSNVTGEPFCDCPSEYTGTTCEQLLDNDSGGGDDGTSLPIIISVSVVAGILLIVIIALVVCFVFAKKKRAISGRYSPSRNENLGFNVEMSNALKPPPEERLI